MQSFFDKITHGQARIILLSVGISFVSIGCVMVFLSRPSFDGWLFNGGGALGTVGLVIIALELSGQRRVLRMGFGFLVLLIGLILSIPAVPGPGFVFVLLGLAVLAMDFLWAKNLLHRVNTIYRNALEKVKKKRASKKTKTQTVADEPPTFHA